MFSLSFISDKGLTTKIWPLTFWVFPEVNPTSAVGNISPKLSFKYSATDTKNSDIDDSFYESNMNFLSSLHFSGKKGQGGNVKCVACLNAFVHNMIDNLEYKGYYFNSAQELKRGLSRWMMLRLYHLWRYAAPGKTYHFRFQRS